MPKDMNKDGIAVNYTHRFCNLFVFVCLLLFGIHNQVKDGDAEAAFEVQGAENLPKDKY